MKNLKNILFITITVLTYSCSPIRYVPNAVFIPLMQQKGQVSANASLTASEETSGLELNTAVAVTKNVALMANYSSVSSTNSDKLSLVELGGGYFKSIGNYGSFETNQALAEAAFRLRVTVTVLTIIMSPTPRKQHPSRRYILTGLFYKVQLVIPTG